MKKTVFILFLILIIGVFACACDDGKAEVDDPGEIKVYVKLCGEDICEVNATAIDGERFKLSESEEEKLINSLTSSPYYIGRFTVRYAPGEVFRYGEGESGYWLDFGDMNVGYVVKDGDSYVAYSHGAYFGNVTDDEEDQVFIATESFLTSEPDTEENPYFRSYLFVMGESYPVGYGWEELKEIFANYDIDESKLTIGAQLVNQLSERRDIYLSLIFESETKSLKVEIGSPQ